MEPGPRNARHAGNAGKGVGGAQYQIIATEMGMPSCNMFRQLAQLSVEVVGCSTCWHNFQQQLSQFSWVVPAVHSICQMLRELAPWHTTYAGCFASWPLGATGVKCFAGWRSAMQNNSSCQAGWAAPEARISEVAAARIAPMSVLLATCSSPLGEVRRSALQEG